MFRMYIKYVKRNLFPIYVVRIGGIINKLLYILVTNFS
jgi:hypothetical protein